MDILQKIVDMLFLFLLSVYIFNSQIGRAHGFIFTRDLLPYFSQPRDSDLENSNEHYVPPFFPFLHLFRRPSTFFHISGKKEVTDGFRTTETHNESKANDSLSNRQVTGEGNNESFKSAKRHFPWLPRVKVFGRYPVYPLRHYWEMNENKTLGPLKEGGQRASTLMADKIKDTSTVKEQSEDALQKVINSQDEAKEKHRLNKRDRFQYWREKVGRTEAEPMNDVQENNSSTEKSNATRGAAITDSLLTFSRNCKKNYLVFRYFLTSTFNWASVVIVLTVILLIAALVVLAVWIKSPYEVYKSHFYKIKPLKI